MRVFLSAVSSQFQECRNQLASDLRATGHEVVYQDDFRQGDTTLLAKLEELVVSCDRVIALVGARAPARRAKQAVRTLLRRKQRA